MFSALRNIFSFSRKDDLSYLKSLAGKQYSFEKQYKDGIYIGSHFKAIAVPKSGHNAALLFRSNAIGRIHVLTGNIVSINWQIETPAIFSDDSIFRQPVTLQPSEVATIDTPNILDHHEIFSFIAPTSFCHWKGIFADATIVDVTDLLQQDLCTICTPFRCLSPAFTVDVTDSLYQDLYASTIVNIPVKLFSRIDGKIYQPASKEESSRQEKTTEAQRPKLDCRNLIRQKKTKRKKSKPAFNIFDLILPILQRPLGQAFDDALSFPAPLYCFQVDGVRFLKDRRAALLGDEMGLGKTIQAITACRVLFRQGKISSVCVVCPKAILTNWKRELRKWAPELEVIKVTEKAHWESGAHVYVCTYERLRIDFEKHSHYWHQKKYTSSAGTHFDLMILDEIQKTKNPTIKTTKTVRKIDAHYRWGMSGTPLENSIDDLVTICETLEPTIFKAIKLEDWNEHNVKKAYQPIFLRRRSKDVLDDMPEKVTDYIWLELSPEQQTKYDLAERAGISELEALGEDVTFQHVVTLITKLKLICNYEPESNKSVKLEFLQDELEELAAEDNKALVFSSYPDKTLRKIKPALEIFKPEIYEGKLSDSARNRIIDDFQSKEDNKIMLLSSTAGNVGITLTRANYVFHFDMWWNPAVAAQAVGRVLRIGQKSKVVFEYFLLTRGTIEERIYAKVEEKKQLFDRMVDDLSVGDDTIARKLFNQEELLDLFDLKLPKKQSAKPTIQNEIPPLPSRQNSGAVRKWYLPDENFDTYAGPYTAYELRQMVDNGKIESNADVVIFDKDGMEGLGIDLVIYENFRYLTPRQRAYLKFLGYSGSMYISQDDCDHAIQTLKTINPDGVDGLDFEELAEQEEENDEAFEEAADRYVYVQNNGYAPLPQDFSSARIDESVYSEFSFPIGKKTAKRRQNLIAIIRDIVVKAGVPMSYADVRAELDVTGQYVFKSGCEGWRKTNQIVSAVHNHITKYGEAALLCKTADGKIAVNPASETDGYRVLHDTQREVDSYCNRKYDLD